jgi:hypothetical protein
MTHQAPPPPQPSAADPGRQIAQLREALRLVERIAGRPALAADESRLEAAATVSAAYVRALPVAQRRFDALAAETAIWAAAGVEALLLSGDGPPPRAAASRLADRLTGALNALEASLR